MASFFCRQLPSRATTASRFELYRILWMPILFHHCAVLCPTCACYARDTWASILLGTGTKMVFSMRSLSSTCFPLEPPPKSGKRVGWHRHSRHHAGAARSRYRCRVGEGELPQCFPHITLWLVRWEHAASSRDIIFLERLLCLDRGKRFSPPRFRIRDKGLTWRVEGGTT